MTLMVPSNDRLQEMKYNMRKAVKSVTNGPPNLNVKTAPELSVQQFYHYTASVLQKTCTH